MTSQSLTACTITETSIRMPEAPALTDKQIAWARSHDWFVGKLGDYIEVADRYTKDGRYFENVIVWTAGFRALRDWAGY